MSAPTKTFQFKPSSTYGSSKLIKKCVTERSLQERQGQDLIFLSQETIHQNIQSIQAQRIRLLKKKEQISQQIQKAIQRKAHLDKYENKWRQEVREELRDRLWKLKNKLNKLQQPDEPAYQMVRKEQTQYYQQEIKQINRKLNQNSEHGLNYKLDVSPWKLEVDYINKEYKQLIIDRQIIECTIETLEKQLIIYQEELQIRFSTKALLKRMH